MKLEKNKVYDVEVTGLTHEALGVVKIDGFPIFVKNALPSEFISVKVTEIKKNFALGKLIKIYQRSKDRIEPEFNIFKEGGGCNLLHLSYNGQLEVKRNLVKETLKRIGKINVDVYECIGMEYPWKYRNKTQVPFGVINGKVVAGFYKEKTHDIIDMESCVIQDDITDKIIVFMKKLCVKYNIIPYDEQLHTGNLRHVNVRRGHITNEYMVTLVTREDKVAQITEIIEDLITEFPMIKSIVQNINNKKSNTILGEETIVLYGQKYIYDYIGNVKFAISSKSFFQVNPIQTKVLYDKVLEYANLTGKETLIDAYCGIGSIGLYLSKQAKAIYGVEIVPEAIEDAKLNAKLNDFDNAHYELGPAEDIIKKWQQENINADIIIVDPPRKGCDIKLLETIIEMKIPKIIYVSCDPATLARDLRILNENNYTVQKVQPVDMFPHTMHVETIVLMSRF